MQAFGPQVDRPFTVRGAEFHPDDPPEQYLQKLARIALDEIFHLVGVLSTEGVLLDCNRPALDRGGVTRDEVAGKPIWDTFWWSLSTQNRQELRDAFGRAAKGELVRYDVELLDRKNGQETTTVDLTLRPVRDDQERVVFLLVEGREIEKASSQIPVNPINVRGTKLLSGDTREQYRQKIARITLDSMVQFVGLLDANGTVLEINKVALDAVGIKLSEVEGKPFWTTFWWQVSEEINQTLRDSIGRAAQGEFVRWDAEIYGRAGGKETIIIDASLMPVTDEQGNVVFIAAEGRDITEKKAHEREIARQREELAKLDVLKTQFFANISHEFRTPLTLMLGPLEDLMALEDELPSEVHESLRVAHRNSLRLLRLVNTLLDFSRIEAGRVQASFEPVDLAALTADLGSTFRSAMEKAGLDFIVECPPLAEPVYVDREMWEKVVLNFLSNAFKYTFQGAVTLKTEQVDGHAVLSVADTGTGIPGHELPHLFERFHRVEGARGRTLEGSGIGLALVAELVKLHGGRVDVESRLAKGSIFKASIPLGTAHLPADRIGAPRALASTAIRAESFVEEALRWLPGENGVPSATDLPSPSPSGAHAPAGRILVADDNADMREYVRGLLGARYQIATAVNGAEALQSAVEDPPDLVLADVMMPELDGFGLVEGLRANPQTSTVPIILLSARAGEEARSEGMDAGADDYLVKPFSARELLARVGAHIRLSRARKEAEEARRRSEERLQQVFTQAPVAIIVVRGPEFVVELANPSYRDLLHGRDVVGRRFADVVPEIGSEMWDAFRQVIATGQPYVRDGFHIPYDQDGDGIVEDHWFNVVYHPLREADGSISGLVAVCDEVSRQVLARKELERANRELEEFAYVASHDLQEPLRMVNIYTQLLLKESPAAGETAQEYAGFIQKGVTRMEDLIRDLLSYSRAIHREGSDEGAADLSQSLAQALENCASSLKESGGSVTSEPLPVVRGDTTQLAHVFQNLLSNALKYRRTGVVPDIRISARLEASQWIVTVEDNGIGFDQKYAERIFGLFKRLHNDAYNGTGLGLAICQRIVERYGGHMWATGKPGVGASFSFSLPQADN